jgi:lipoprotein
MSIKKCAVVATAVVLACSTMLSACSLGSAASKGGDTTCAEYLKMSNDEKAEEIKFLLKEKDDGPSNGAISTAKMSATLFCKTAGSDNSRIREING